MKQEQQTPHSLSVQTNTGNALVENSHVNTSHTHTGRKRFWLEKSWLHRPPGVGKFGVKMPKNLSKMSFFLPILTTFPQPFPKKKNPKKISNNFGRFAPKKFSFQPSFARRAQTLFLQIAWGGPQPSWKLRAGKMVLAGGTPPQAPRGKIPLA